MQLGICVMYLIEDSRTLGGIELVKLREKLLDFFPPFVGLGVHVCENASSRRAHLCVEPGLGGSPFAFHGTIRGPEDFSDLFRAHTSKKTKLDDAALSGPSLRQTVQRFVKRDQVLGLVCTQYQL